MRRAEGSEELAECLEAGRSGVTLCFHGGFTSRLERHMSQGCIGGGREEADSGGSRSAARGMKSYTLTTPPASLPHRRLRAGVSAFAFGGRARSSAPKSTIFRTYSRSRTAAHVLQLA